jgi:hypothetical protein
MGVKLIRTGTLPKSRVLIVLNFWRMLERCRRLFDIEWVIQLALVVLWFELITISLDRRQINWQ